MGDGYISFYEGGYSSLSPESGNYVGFRLNAGQLASTTSPMTANQLNETISRIKEGARNVEVTLVSPEVVEGIPKQQFQEMHALMKLTGVKPSMHAPVMDPSGFGGQQQIYSESEREDTERRFMDALEKAYELDPTGNIPVVFHASNAGTGASYRPEGKEGDKDRFHVFEDAIVNRDTGQLQKVKEDRMFSQRDVLDPNKKLTEQGHIQDAKTALRTINEDEWDNRIRQILMLKKEAQENMEKAAGKGLFDYIEKKKELPQEQQIELENYLGRIQVFQRDAERSFATAFSKAYEYGDKDQRKELAKLANVWKEEQKKLEEQTKDNNQKRQIFQVLMDKRLTDLNNVVAEKDKFPEIYMNAQDFTKEKASETFGNLAWNSYKKWKDNSPIIAIENLYPGMSFSRAEDLKELIEKTKKNFVAKAKENGLSESEAKNKADKLIGATWDVGHLNIHKKHGFTDKDLTEETKKIAKLVKHVHLTDNFGFGDSHLAMGMGNVPIKEHLKILEKQGKFDEMRKVIEAGGLVNPNMGLKMNPLRATLGAFGSPIMGGENPIYWNQAENIQGNYFGFPMAYMPEKHFSMYGSGFSTLPEELGGQIPGTQSRFSGTPNS
jgi:hypothetical protein